MYVTTRWPYQQGNGNDPGVVMESTKVSRDAGFLQGGLHQTILIVITFASLQKQKHQAVKVHLH